MTGQHTNRPTVRRRAAHRRALALGAAFAILVAACSGGGDDDSTDDTSSETTPDTATDPTGDTATTEPAGGDDPPPTDSATTDTADVDASAVAIAWLRDVSELDDALVDQLVETRVVPAGPVTHVDYQHRIDDRRVRASEITVHVLADGTVQGATISLTEATPSDATIAHDESAAASSASKAVDGTVEGTPGVEPIWTQIGMELVPAWLVSVSTRNPASAWQVVVDATTGNVLSADRAREIAGGHGPPSQIGGSLPVELPRQAADACDAGPAPSACVFFNPFAQSGSPVSPGDANDWLFPVSLEGLADDDDLVGQFVDTVFAGSPAPPEPEADGVWGGGVGSRNFEAVMSYYWLDRTQRYLQSIGHQIRSDAATQIVPLFGEEVDNAFFDAIENRVFMGVGSDGINAAQDAFVLVHEYGHAVLDAQVGTDTHFSSQELGAYSEGFSDLLAALTTLELHNGPDPACVGGWFFAQNECFRNLNNSKVFPDDLEFAVHADGELYAAAVWDVFEGFLATQGLTPADCSTNEACLPIRDRMVQLVLAAHFYFTPGMDFIDITDSYLRANQATFADADRTIIEQAFAARGLLGESGTTMTDTGQRPEPSTGDTVSLTIDIVHDYRGDVRLTAGVADADFQPLCEEIVLAEPDPSDADDNLFGTIDVSDSPCAQFVPPSPDQLWFLFAADELADDEGEIVEFVVNVGDAPYPAVNLPRLIPDGDPEGTAAIVDGTGGAVNEEGQAEPGAPVDGQPFVTLDITHPYAGDLMVRAGVADVDDDIICSVPIQNPDPSDGSGGLIGSVDMSECAALYPPAADRQWFLQVIDTAALDEGTVDQFSLTGPDGAVFEFADVPVTVPDADDDGIALILTDTGSSNGEAGGSGQSSSLELPAISLEVTHSYVGDLAITAGVADAALEPLCEVVVRAPDAADGAADLSGDVSLAECARFYPPSPDQLWYLFVRDTFADDSGTVQRFTLQGEDGQVFDSVDAPFDVPDADQNGIVLLIDGSESMTTTGEDAIASFVIEHSYAGDLYIEVGVADAAGNALCGLVVQEPDPGNGTIDVAETIDMSECVDLGFYPPSPNQQWYVYAEDTAPFDEGSITAFVVGGPDGETRTADNITPVLIPDADPDGVFVFFDS